MLIFYFCFYALFTILIVFAWFMVEMFCATKYLYFARKRTIAKEARFNVFPATSKKNRCDMGNHGGSQGRFFHL